MRRDFFSVGEIDRSPFNTTPQRQRDFVARIARHRAGGNKQSDDYYGDKVVSRATYRSWLRDQRAVKRRESALGSIEPPKPGATVM